jgi:hypothetical protein
VVSTFTNKLALYSFSEKPHISPPAQTPRQLLLLLLLEAFEPKG